MNTHRIDLNADLGEGFGPWRMGEDEALLEVLTSANIACGFHAGDPSIMARTIRLAGERGVDIGAHVSYPDLQGFGRRAMLIEADELASLVLYQLGALAGLARAQRRRVSHMSFHGALGNKVAADAALADTLLAAVAAFDSNLLISSSPSAAIEQAAKRHGLAIATTFLADRACDEQGLLIPRQQPGAVIHDPDLVLQRVRQLLVEGSVTTYAGRTVPIHAHSILLHGDTPGALELARLVRQELVGLGIEPVPLSRQQAALA